MRDPAVLAVFALRITAAEHARLAAGLPIVRPYWPPQSCRGSVVGLHVAGEVLGEALLTCAAAPDGGCAWSVGPVTTYARRLPHPAPRGMASPMPAAPMGTLTPARDWGAYA
jgi:hypothetical protein